MENNATLEALRQLRDSLEEPPEPNCSCHISPPCNDCYSYGALREAIEVADRIILEAEE